MSLQALKRRGLFAVHMIASPMEATLEKIAPGDLCPCLGVCVHSFEFLSEFNTWVPLRDKYIIDQLGLLSAYNMKTEVSYRYGGHTYKARQVRAVAAHGGLCSQTKVGRV